jgi:hypothetical protein
MTVQAIVEFLDIVFSKDKEYTYDDNDVFNEPKGEVIKLKATVSVKVRLGSTNVPMSVAVHPKDDLSDIKSLVLAELHAFGSALADATQTPK